MWVYLDSWLVQDGEVPELRLGDTFRQAAVRAACLTLHGADADAPDGHVELPQPAASSGRVTYSVTGTALACREPGEVLLRVGSLHLLAEPADVREVPGTKPRECMLERYSPEFAIPSVGDRVTATCTYEVLAGHEIAIHELRADWRVRGLRIERRATTPVELRKAKILRVDTVDRLERWADERGEDRIAYLLDLEPTGYRGGPPDRETAASDLSPSHRGTAAQ